MTKKEDDEEPTVVEEKAQETYTPPNDSWEHPLLEDIICDFEFKQELEDIVHSIENPAIYQMFGVKPAKVFMFSGEAGTGKTYSAKAIRNVLAMHNQLIKWFPYDIGTHGTAYINMGAVNMTKVFKQGHKAANRGNTVLYFFDEADVLLSKRGQDRGRYKEDDKITNAWMKAVNDINQYGEREYMILTTNFEENLDDAVMRAGRVDKILRFPMPNIFARMHTWEYYIQKTQKVAAFKYIKDYNPQKLAEISEGFSFADIEGVIDEVVRNYITDAVRNTSDKISELKVLTFNDIVPYIEKHRERKRNVFTKRQIGFR